MRLQRVGRKNDPSYRIVVTNKRTGPKSDKHVDRIGSYNPKLKNFQLDEDKAKEWLAKGVQPSDTMHNLLISKGVIKGKKINVLPKKTPIVSEEVEEEKAPEAPATESEEATESAEETTEEAVKEEQVETETTEEKAAEETKEEATESEEKVEEPKKEEEAPVEEAKEEKKEETEKKDEVNA